MLISENKRIVEDFEKEVSVKRVLAHINGKKETPTVVIIAGIHGNEKAGIIALNNVIQKIKDNSISFEGNFYAISGNINALKKGIRYDTVDLNRVWTESQIEDINTSVNGFNPDVNEQIEIYNTIKNILSQNKGPFYFIDLHTTSAATEPFITISDSLNNRKFTSNFSIPIILGIEEYLEGPLLTYINEYGHISLGFEAGQHDDSLSITNCEAFIWLSLVISKCVKKNQIENYEHYQHLLSKNKGDQDFYEIKYKYGIDKGENFNMIDGFENFQKITKNQLLAYSNSLKIKSTLNGKVFMPLYQRQGNDGFFIIKPISKFWLNLSKSVRKLKLYQLLRILPGIKQEKTNKYTLIVNPKTARFLADEIFHLFGYRKKVKKDDRWYFIKRDREVSRFS